MSQTSLLTSLVLMSGVAARGGASASVQQSSHAHSLIKLLYSRLTATNLGISHLNHTCACNEHMQYAQGMLPAALCSRYSQQQ